MSLVLLRAATESDLELLWRWANDPADRAASANSNPISLETHSRWFRESLRNPTREIFIAEVDGTSVGTVRIDKGNEVSELSWSVAAEHRGRGYGREMVSMAAARIHGPVMARIRESNVPSIRIAESCGLRLAREEDGLRVYIRNG